MREFIRSCRRLAPSLSVRVSRARYETVDKKRAASVRTKRGESEFRRGFDFRKERHMAHLVSQARTCACACVCAIYCAALSKEISPGAPKPFHNCVDQMSPRYCAALSFFFFFFFSFFFFFRFFFFNTDVEPRNGKAIRRPLIVQIDPSRPDSYLSRHSSDSLPSKL